MAAIGTEPLSYQWRRNGVNVACSSATSCLSYTTPATTAADNGALYSVVITNPVGPVTSFNAVLTANPAPIAPLITAQVQSVTVTQGQAATFSVSATGTAPLSYQWRRNGVNVSCTSSSNCPSYTIQTTTVADNGSTFSVVVSNAVGTATSSLATLSVSEPAPTAPGIQIQPVSLTIAEGRFGSFSLTASGTQPLTYRWKRNGRPLTLSCDPNCTSISWSDGNPEDNGAQFSVVVSNAYGSVESRRATLKFDDTRFALWGAPNPQIPSSPPSATSCTVPVNESIQSYTSVAGFKVYSGGCVASLTLTATEWSGILNGNTDLLRKQLPRRFSLAFLDSFDFAIFILDSETTPAQFGGLAGQYFSLGTQQPTRSRRLMGSIFFPFYGSDPIAGGPSLHEFLHAWGNNNILPSTADPEHWGFSSVGGVQGGYYGGVPLVNLGGNNWQAKGPPSVCLATATATEIAQYCSPRPYFGLQTNGGNSNAYAPFELFIMGLLPSESTPNVTYAQDPVWVDQSKGIFSATKIVAVTPAEVLLQLGTLAPDPRTSQKHFRMATVFLTQKDVLPASVLTRFNSTLEDFAKEGTPNYGNFGSYIYNHNFFTATGGRATMQTGRLIDEKR